MAICDAYEQSQMGQEMLEFVRAKPLQTSSGMDDVSLENRKRSPYKASWWNQSRAVLWRSWMTVLRDPAFLTIKASTALVYIKLTSLTFYIYLLFCFSNTEDRCSVGVADLSGSVFDGRIYSKYSRSSVPFPHHRQFQQRLRSDQRISFFLFLLLPSSNQESK